MHSIKTEPDGGSLASLQITIITPGLNAANGGPANPVGF